MKNKNFIIKIILISILTLTNWIYAEEAPCRFHNILSVNKQSYSVDNLQITFEERDLIDGGAFIFVKYYGPGENSADIPGIRSKKEISIDGGNTWFKALTPKEVGKLYVSGNTNWPVYGEIKAKEATTDNENNNPPDWDDDGNSATDSDEEVDNAEETEENHRTATIINALGIDGLLNKKDFYGYYFKPEIGKSYGIRVRVRYKDYRKVLSGEGGVYSVNDISLLTNDVVKINSYDFSVGDTRLTGNGGKLLFRGKLRGDENTRRFAMISVNHGATWEPVLPYYPARKGHVMQGGLGATPPIEKLLEGEPEATLNDISSWKYSMVPSETEKSYLSMKMIEYDPVLSEGYPVITKINGQEISYASDDERAKTFTGQSYFNTPSSLRDVAFLNEGLEESTVVIEGETNYPLTQYSEHIILTEISLNNGRTWQRTQMDVGGGSILGENGNIADEVLTQIMNNHGVIPTWKYSFVPALGMHYNFKTRIRVIPTEFIHRYYGIADPARAGEDIDAIADEEAKAIIDEVTLNDREVELSLDQPLKIEFYEDDLIDGKMYIRGLIEDNIYSDDLTVRDMTVKITTDDGMTWHDAMKNTLGEEWHYSFEPELDTEYTLGVKVMFPHADPDFIKNDDVTNIEMGTLIPDNKPIKKETIYDDICSVTPEISGENVSYIVSCRGDYGVGESSVPFEDEEIDTSIPDGAYTIAGFYLYIDRSKPHFIKNGKLTGSGQIGIPWMSNVDANGIVHDGIKKIDIDLVAVGFNKATKQVTGDITFTSPFNYTVSDITFEINRLHFSGSTNKATLSGFVQSTKTDLLRKIGKIELTNILITNEGISGNISSHIAKSFMIYEPSQVKLNLDEVKLTFDFTQSKHDVTVDTIKAKLDFGSMLNHFDPVALDYANNVFTLKSNTRDMPLLGGKIRSLSGSISEVAGSYEVSFGGQFSFPADPVLGSLGLQEDEMTYAGIKINSSGVEGSFTLSPHKSYDLIGEKVQLLIETIGMNVSLNTDKKLAMELTSLDAKLNLSKVLTKVGGEDLIVGLVKNGDIYEWQADIDATLPGTNDKFIFQALNGQVNFIDNFPILYVSGVKFKYADLPDVQFAMNDFGITSAGVSATVGLDAGNSGVLGAGGFSLNKFDIRFENSRVANGSIELLYQNNDFLGSQKPFSLALSGLIDNEGIHELSASGNQTFTVPDFADFTFTKATMATELNSAFWVEFNGQVKPTNKTLKNFSHKIAFKGLRLSKDGVTVSSVGSSVNIQARAKLAGFDLSLTKFGMGFEGERFFIRPSGEIAIGISGSTVKSATTISLYSDGKLKVNDIGLDVHIAKGMGSFAGDVKWLEDDPVFGDGFQGEMQLSLVKILTLEGKIVLGHKDEKLYWMAVGQGGAAGMNIPIPSTGLSFYQFGGGAAYNMSWDDTSKQYIPGGGALMLRGSTKIGTADMGHTWHGDVSLDVSTNGTLMLNGDSWIDSELSQRPADKYIGLRATLGVNPPMLHIEGNANIKMKPGGNRPTLVHVHGDADVLFSQNDWHIYIGEKNRPVTINLLEVLDGNGYFMLDSNALAFGEGVTIYKKGSCCYAWGKIDGGAQFDFLANFQPFFVDAEGKIWIHIAAGVGSWEALSMGADVSTRFRSPDPTFMKLKMHAYIKTTLKNISFSKTFWIGHHPTQAEEDALPPIVATIEPDAGMDSSVLPIIRIKTMTAMAPYSTSVGGDEYNSEIKEFRLVDLNRSSRGIMVESKKTARNEMSYVPREALTLGHTYQIEGLAVRKNLENNHIERENYAQTFKVSNRGLLSLNDIIGQVVPARDAENVQPDSTKIGLYYTQLANRIVGNHTERLLARYKPNVYDSNGEKVEGVWHMESKTSAYARDIFGNLPTTSDERPTVHSARFRANQPLKAHHYCKDLLIGEIRETRQNDEGEYLNPFVNFQVDSPVDEESEEREETEQSEDSDNGVEQLDVSTRQTTTSGVLTLNGARVNISGRLGKFSKMVNNRYAYYTNKMYKIKVLDSERDNKVVFVSGFKIKTQTRGDHATNTILENPPEHPTIKMLREIPEARITEYRMARNAASAILDSRLNSGEWRDDASCRANRYLERTCERCEPCRTGKVAALKRVDDLYSQGDIQNFEVDMDMNENNNNIFAVVVVSMHLEKLVAPQKGEIQNFGFGYKKIKVLWASHGKKVVNIPPINYQYKLHHLASATIKYYISENAASIDDDYQRALRGDIEPVLIKQMEIVDTKRENNHQPMHEHGTTQHQQTTTQHRQTGRGVFQ